MTSIYRDPWFLVDALASHLDALDCTCTAEAVRRGTRGVVGDVRQVTDGIICDYLRVDKWASIDGRDIERQQLRVRTIALADHWLRQAAIVAEWAQ